MAFNIVYGRTSPRLLYLGLEMSEKLDAKVIEAAGGIVERATSQGPLIAVVYRERYGDEWGLPKGKRQPGESWQTTALREVEEEIGLTPVIESVAGATAYLAGGVPKLVLYWRMRAGRDIRPFSPNEEVVRLDWLAPADAIERLTHREERDLVRRVFLGERA
jgi:8-oxo-dGTP pyrophosphatase MutT (NUDIX family)